MESHDRPRLERTWHIKRERMISFKETPETEVLELLNSALNEAFLDFLQCAQMVLSVCIVSLIKQLDFSFNLMISANKNLFQISGCMGSYIIGV